MISNMFESRIDDQLKFVQWTFLDSFITFYCFFLDFISTVNLVKNTFRTPSQSGPTYSFHSKLLLALKIFLIIIKYESIRFVLPKKIKLSSKEVNTDAASIKYLLLLL